MNATLPPSQASQAGNGSGRAALSPGQHTVLPGQTPEGKPILSALLKRSYVIVRDAMAQRAEADRPLVPGDVPWQDPQTSSVRWESDFVPFKLGTDVVLNGKVYAPQGVACQQTEAELRIGKTSKRLLVTGSRRAVFTGATPRFTEPQPFKTLDLKYELAYGGIDVFSDRNCQYPYPRNPLGLGFVVANTREAVDKRVLPSLEDPDHPLTPERLCVLNYVQGWEAQPMPANFGWFPKTWLPRAALAGVMPGDRATEQELRKAYAPFVPKQHRSAYDQTKLPDMNFQFFSGASPGLSLPYLQGAEQLSVRNLTPDEFLRFQLPDDRPAVSIDIGQGAEQPDVVLQTVMIDLEERRIDLVWRAAISYPGMDWLPQMSKLEVHIQ